MKKLFLFISIVAFTISSYMFWFFTYEKPKQQKKNRKGILIISQ